MLRKIVRIDESKCDGCGACVPSCAEGAIAIVDGKARLVGDVLCDGLGACLGECPRGAISVIEREAEAFDEQAVKARLTSVPKGGHAPPAPKPGARLSVLAGGGDAIASGGCPGSRPVVVPRSASTRAGGAGAVSRLGQWPVQLHLVSPHAPYFRGADLLVAADCVPFAYAAFHDDFLDGRAVVIGCPKLDDVTPYAEKLAAIIGLGEVKTVTVVRMEVPCCGGISRLAQAAIAATNRNVPFRDVVVAADGAIRSDR